jgi:hypothetical protein
MFESLTKYANIFGAPNTGAHSYRIFDIAIVDAVGTILIAYLIHYYWFPQYSFFVSLLILFGLGILLHHIFGVRTTIDKLLFG